jgi:hypothetical protein
VRPPIPDEHAWIISYDKKKQFPKKIIALCSPHRRRRRRHHHHHHQQQQQQQLDSPTRALAFLRSFFQLKYSAIAS